MTNETTNETKSKADAAAEALENALLRVADAGAAVADSAHRSQPGSEYTKVHADDVDELREAVKAWRAAGQAFHDAVREDAAAGVRPGVPAGQVLSAQIRHVTQE